MKRSKLIGFVILFLLALSGSRCKKLLEEHPKDSVLPSIYNTESGLVGGVAAVYNDLRNFWGTEAFSLQGLAGTDEHLEGSGATSLDFFTYNPLNSADGNSLFWGNAYQDINTLNAVLQYAKKLAPDTIVNQCVAQAHFLRAFWYYHLVISFGDVPLHTTYNTTPTQADSRQPMAQVYDTIIADLTYAAANLQAQSPVNATSVAPFGGKAAAQGVALYLLGKTYLTRGWSTAAQPSDFRTAATILAGLTTPAAQTLFGFGLWQDYADVFGENVNPVTASRATWDYGKENMLISDHSSNAKYGQYTVGSQASGGAAQNLQPWFQRWNYPANSGINSYVANGSLVNNGTAMMTRDVLNGRPYLRARPNNAYVLNQAFDSVDRVNDSRYNKTFQTVWIANTSNISNTAGAAHNSRGNGNYTLTVGVDTAVWIPPYEVPGAPQFNGATPFKGIIIPPSLQSSTYFPANRKFDDPSRAAGNFNDPSTRPVTIFRYADVYLLAAEAYFKLGMTDSAAFYLNKIRERGAYQAGNTPTQNAAAAAAMDITGADVTLDFILDERTREFFGEGLRWWDLVRTGSLLNRVQKWNPVEAGAHIQPYMVLRPIPQQEIDAVTQGPKFPQNPGY